jgi:Ca2+-binding EF-hand superfamily protein
VRCPQVMAILPTLKKLDGVSCIEWNTRMNSGNESELREVCNRIDADGGGTLDQDELRASVKDPEIAKFMKMEPVDIEVILFKILKTGAEELSFEDFCYYFKSS